MKKFLVVLLSLGLIAAFAATASALDVKFSGGYYVAGVYDDNPSLIKKGSSRAAFFQRTRVQTVFVVQEGLSMTTRFDALEKQWGNTDYRSITAAGEDKTNSRIYTAGNNKQVQENLELERGFITFNTMLGKFDVGYQQADKWGTEFGDNECTRPRVKYTTQIGPFTMLAIYEKVFDNDTAIPAGYASKQTDADWDNYFLAGIYNFKGGAAGLLYKNVVNNSNRPIAAAGNFSTNAMAFVPYVKATFGPVYLEGEFAYQFGKAAKFDGESVNVGKDIDLSGWSAYLMAKVKLGPAYVGGQGAMITGDDGSDAKKSTTGPNGGYDYQPTLMLNNLPINTWLPNAADSGVVSKSSAYGYTLINIFGGIDPTPKLNFEAALSMVGYEKTPANISKTVGTEFDVTGTYKIYDNLSYMVGAAYLFTGDAWKGTSTTKEVSNNYLLMNKLTLSF